MNRPTHIPADWWARASWAARQAAIDHAHRETRRIDTLRTRVETERITHTWRYRRHELALEPDNIDTLLNGAAIPPSEIAEGFATTVGVIRDRMIAAGRPDLATPFHRGRNTHPCADCGKGTVYGLRCKSCAGKVREAAKRRAA